MIKKNSRIKLQRKRIQFYFKIDMFIKGNGKIIKEVDVVCKYGKMDRFIKDIGNPI
jgi:hypothetical protein